MNLDELSKKIGAVDGAYERFIKKTGLTYSHFALLYSLAKVCDEHSPSGDLDGQRVKGVQGMLTQKQIADEWYLPKQTIFTICKHYKERGFLVFADNPDDKRERLLGLTELGKRYAMPLLDCDKAVGQAVFGAFGEQKTAQLFELLTELARVFDEKVTQMPAVKLDENLRDEIERLSHVV